MNMVVKLYTNSEALSAFLKGESTLTASPVQTSQYNTEIQIDPSEFDVDTQTNTLFVIKKKRQVL
jgi:hypothetical protein